MASLAAFEDYTRAQKMAQREYREKMLAGQYPYLPVLDELLVSAETDAQLPLGLLEIPLSRVVGTKTAGRTAAFAANFMPLLSADTEFAAKWCALCAAHVEEGIRDPIRCFEYLGRFYVQEGNKRVSVLKYFGALSISANVTRIVPRWSDTPEVRQYFEFLEAWPVVGAYFLQFTQPGGYVRLQKAMGKAPGERWSDEDRAELRGLYAMLEKAYAAAGGAKRRAAAGDVLLILLRVYPYAQLCAMTGPELEKALKSVWDDVLALENPAPVAVSTKPAPPAEGKLLGRLIPAILAGPEHLKVAFVNERTPQTSSWTSQHEFGRGQLEKTFGSKVTTAAYNGAVPHENDDALVEQAIAEGADVVFTTSPQLAGAALRAAAKHPEVRILNCAMELPYTGIRTYYTRVYEAKFITGAIAGAMAGDDRIGYIASYPIYGVPANINAFALGARMVNPRAKVELSWSCLPGDPMEPFTSRGIAIISGHDSPAIGHPQKEFGTFQRAADGQPVNLAAPFWHWGQFYENVIRTILDGGWQRDKSGKDGRAVSYWWGMNSGVMDVLLSRELPADVQHLAHILREGVISGAVEPFRCRIVGQDGTVRNDGTHSFPPEQIMHMDWLCDAVVGTVPEYDDLADYAKPMYRMQGVHRDRLPPEKGAQL